MKLIRAYLFILLAVTYANGMTTKSPELSTSCPNECRCQTTAEGLHKATCYSLSDLYKYSLRNKHHNINILDLSYSNISKLNNELDRFTEIVTLDLSHNSLTSINRFLINSKKLVHLNLANNDIEKFRAEVIPTSVSSLDLRNNKLKDLPLHLSKLRDLEHLQLEGNPFSCSCDNVKKLQSLQGHGVVIDHVLCASNGKKWNQILDTCNTHKSDKNKILLEDMMMGDQPTDTDLPALNDLNTGIVLDFDKKDDADDEKEFFGIVTEKSTVVDSDIHIDNLQDLFENSTEKSINIDVQIEGSGDEEESINEKLVVDERFNSNDTQVEGSGDDSFLPFRSISSSTSDPLENNDEDEFESSGSEGLDLVSTSTEPFTIPILPPIDYDQSTKDPNIYPKMPTLFQGDLDWNKPEVKSVIPSLNAIPTSVNPELPVDDNTNVVKTEDSNSMDNVLEGYSEEAKPTPKTSTGTYICIGLIFGLLVGLIGITVIKSHLRKKKERSSIRQQRTDIEKAGKEMVDMNKSLLGKPVISNDDAIKKLNGNYELVPTHDSKKPENGDNKTSTFKPPNNNTTNENGNGNVPESKNGKKPIEDTPVITITPLKDEDDIPHIDSNGYHEPDPHPTYLPSLDSGIVRIVLTETPKPHTPVLVTRSRSNAGDIIITPATKQTVG